MDGALMEVGPYRLKDKQTLRYNDGSWDEFMNVLFIDNPVGTGYSYVNTDSYIHELTEMAAHLIIFLEKFFTLFPEYEDDDVSCSGYQCALDLTLFCSYISQVNHMLDSIFPMLHRQFSTGTKILQMARNGT